MATALPLHPFESERAWLGADLSGNTEWIRPFTPGEIEELENAARRVMDKGLSPESLTRADFDMPAVALACTQCSP